MKEVKALILEDDSRRIDWFRRRFEAGMDLHTTDDPQEALRLLNRQEYDFVFLDHDLLPEHYDRDTVCDKTTGLCIAKFLGEHPEVSTNAAIFVHTRNWKGAVRMLDALGNRNACVIPFHKLIEIL